STCRHRDGRAARVHFQRPGRMQGTSATCSAWFSVSLWATIGFMARTRVKICGVTRPEDAAAACRHGADAVGIVLHRASARNVPLDRARQSIAAVAPEV